MTHLPILRRAARGGLLAALSGFLLLMPTAEAFAQAEPASSESAFDRFWWSAGLGGAGGRITCDLCEPERDLGPSAELAIGSYAGPGLRVGVEGGGWTHDDDGTRETVYRVGVVAYLRPNLERGAYLTGGFGWTHYDAGSFGYDAPRLSLGVGWDRALGERLRIGNQMVVDASSFGALKNGETTISRSVGLSLVRLSVQLYRP